jgi:hypothetical protein
LPVIGFPDQKKGFSGQGTGRIGLDDPREDLPGGFMMPIFKITNADEMPGGWDLIIPGEKIKEPLEFQHGPGIFSTLHEGTGKIELGITFQNDWAGEDRGRNQKQGKEQ